MLQIIVFCWQVKVWNKRQGSARQYRNVKWTNDEVGHAAQEFHSENKADAILRELVADPERIRQNNHDERETEVENRGRASISIGKQTREIDLLPCEQTFAYDHSGHEVNINGNETYFDRAQRRVQNS